MKTVTVSELAKKAKVKPTTARRRLRAARNAKEKLPPVIKGQKGWVWHVKHSREVLSYISD